MPSVPLDTSFNVAPAPLPGPRVESIASPDDFGGIQAHQAEALASGVEQIGATIQAKQDTDVVQRAEAQFKQDALQFQVDSQERKGMHAWNVTKDTTQWFNDAGSRYRESFDNDTQRQAFLKTFMTTRSQMLASASMHEAQQRDESLNQSAKASIAGTINNASANYSQPGVVGYAVDDITQSTARLADQNGWTPERAALEAGNNLTLLHKQVLQNLVQDDPTQASAYYEHYKGQINGVDRDGIGRLISGAKFTKTSQAFADQAVTSGISEGDAINAARHQFAGPEQEQVVLETKTRYQEISKAREDGQKDAADTAYGIYARTGRISAIPQATLDKLDGRVLLALKHEAEAKVNDKPVKTDPGTFYALRTMAAQDPDAFASQDLRRFKGHLSEASFEQFVDMQQSVAKPAKQAEIVTLDKQLDTTHQMLGWGADQIKKKGAFDQAVLGELSTATTAKGKPLSFEERQAVIDRNAIESAGWSSTRYYEVAGTSAAKTFRPSISDGDRSKIVAVLQKQGIPPTEENIMAKFKLHRGLQ